MPNLVTRCLRAFVSENNFHAPRLEVYCTLIVALPTIVVVRSRSRNLFAGAGGAAGQRSFHHDSSNSKSHPIYEYVHDDVTYIMQASHPLTYILQVSHPLVVAKSVLMLILVVFSHTIELPYRISSLDSSACCTLQTVRNSRLDAAVQTVVFQGHYCTELLTIVLLLYCCLLLWNC